MDMEHEIKKDAPSAQQAAGSIADDPQYKRMLWNVAQDWTRTDRHIALACYIERWADSRAAATPAQPIAVSAPTDEQVEAALVVYMAAWTDHDSMSQCKRNGIRAVLEFAARAAAPVSGPSDALTKLYSRIKEMQEAAYTFGEYSKEAVSAALDGVLDEIDAISAAPVSGQGDKLLTIIAYAYQIVGAHDAPDHILDVLANPEEASAEQIEAMLPYVLEPVSGQGASYIKQACYRVDWSSKEPAPGLLLAAMKEEIADLRAALDSRPRSEDFHIGVSVETKGTYVQVWDGETKLYEQFHEMPRSEGSRADPDELAFNAQRLRNVGKLVGLDFGCDDADIDACRGALLGSIASALRNRALASTTPQKEGAV